MQQEINGIKNVPGVNRAIEWQAPETTWQNSHTTIYRIYEVVL